MRYGPAPAPCEAGEEELTTLLAVLAKLQTAFVSYDPRTASSTPHVSVKKYAQAYADLAHATAKAVSMDLAALKPEVAVG